MKRISLILILFVLASLACNFGAATPTPAEDAVTVVVPVTVEPATDEPAPEPELPEPISGLARSCGNVNLTVPDSLATDIECLVVPPQSGEEIAPWEITPGHVEIGLVGYALADKFHRPRLYIYPAIDLVALLPYAAENINRVREIVDNPGGPFNQDGLPGVHFFNAGKVFASNIAFSNFQNGSGVRSLNVFGQYYAPVNNTDLFYHFQGLSSDGQFYIIAILPVTHPGLQANSQEGSLPANPEFPDYPGFSGDDIESEMAAYYESMTNLLNTAPAATFNPTLTTLDALIQSIQIVP